MKHADFNFFIDQVERFSHAIQQNISDYKEAQFNVILEECRELQKAYKEQNIVEILDGVVDVVWTGLVYFHMNEQIADDTMYFLSSDKKVKPSGDDKTDKAMNTYFFESFIGIDESGSNNYNGVLGFKDSKDLKFLDGMMYDVINLAKSMYCYDLEGALVALAHENASKLNYPENMKDQVFRNNKLQKKDAEGNLYHWYKPADFRFFVFY